MKQVILITAASSGMGKETTLKLIEEGHVDVLINNAGYVIYRAVEDKIWKTLAVSLK